MVDRMTPARRWSALAVLAGAVLLLAIDSTVLFLAVPRLTAQLSPTATEVLWIGDIYSLALAGLLVTMGSLADRFGRKKVLLCGATAFGLASVLAAFAPSAAALIVARLLLGVAGATIMPSTLSLIRNIFTDPKERTRAIAVWSAAVSSGIALGPLLGGVLLEHFWWGSVFLINLPVMVAVLLVGTWLLPESRNPDAGAFDLISSGLSMVTIIPFVYAIKHFASDGFGGGIAASLVISVIGGVLFVRRQRRVEAPTIDLGLFSNAAFSGAILVNFVSVFALSGVLFFLSQYLQLARYLGPLQAGLAQLPIALAALGAVALVGLLLRRLGRGRAIAVAVLTGAVGLAALGLSEGSGLVWVLLAMVPVGLGIGIAETLSVDAVVSAVKPEKAGAAASVSETAYELGVAMGIAVLGSISTVLYRIQLVLPAGLSGEVQTHAKDSLASATKVLEKGSPALEAARSAFISAMELTTMIAGGVMVIAAILAATLIPNSKDAVATGH